jgi:hypothetical protein
MRRENDCSFLRVSACHIFLQFRIHCQQIQPVRIYDHRQVTFPYHKAEHPGRFLSRTDARPDQYAVRPFCRLPQ